MKTVEVGGMHCPKCVASVSKALSEVPGLTNVAVDLTKGLASFEGEAPDDAIKAAIPAAAPVATRKRRRLDMFVSPRRISNRPTPRRAHR